MEKVILATHNKHKLIEFKEILSPLGYEVISLFDLGFFDEIEETGSSFKENSYIKAKTIYDKFNLPVIADDSGLMVDALDGLPGIYSHRFAGENATDHENILKLLDMLKPFKEPYKAKFTCAITFISKDKFISLEGYMFGEISKEIKGEHGFGYDPVFYLKEYGKTVAELDDSIKNNISHRHNALYKFIEELKKWRH